MRSAAIITKPLQVLLLILRMFLTKMSFYSMIVHGCHQLFLLFTFFMRFLPIEKKLHKILFRKYWRKSLNKIICFRPRDHSLNLNISVVFFVPVPSCLVFTISNPHPLSNPDGSLVHIIFYS